MGAVTQFSTMLPEHGSGVSRSRKVHPMKRMFVYAVSLVGGLFSPVLAPGAVFAQLVADPDFNTTVARPAYVKTHPRVLIDEAHANFHTAAGRYKPLADLLTNDGYQVTPLKDKFSVGAEGLSRFGHRQRAWS